MGRAQLRKLPRYLLLGTAMALVVAVALMPSAGLAASAGGAGSTGPAAADVLQGLPADPGAVGGSDWPVSAAVDADEGCCDDGHMWGWGGGWWWWLFMPIGMIIFWGGVIALIIWAIRQFSEGRGGGGSAIEIARDRYARGDISRDEFDQIRRDLA
ncbi:MAG: SHOCT domain-containing protein [Dehalococcoidia bacterium]|nr:MAG: SHOCT domain-containing protein [Dehalococcoidia bacterium]